MGDIHRLFYYSSYIPKEMFNNKFITLTVLQRLNYLFFLLAAYYSLNYSTAITR